MGRLLFLVGAIALLVWATSAGLPPKDSNPQSSYVPAPGDCMVMPQGQDAVYDLYYAEKVNPENCKSFLTQTEAQVLIDNEIKDDNNPLIFSGGVVVGVVLVLLAIGFILRNVGSS